MKRFPMNPTRLKLARAAIAAVLAGVLSLEPALVSAAESSMWADRRRALKSTPDAETARSPRSAASGDLLASLPTVSNPVVSGSSIKTAAAGLARLDLKGQVPEWIQTAVTPFATIQTAKLSAGPSRPTVVMVQDAHLHNEAQHHIGGVIESLGREAESKGERLLVGLEGAAAGPIDLAPYRGADERIVRQVVWALESVSLMSGAEAAAMSNLGTTTAPRQLVSLVGTETLSLYQANVAALRDAVPFEKSARAALSDLRRELVDLKRKHFDAALVRFDSKKDGYEQGTLSLPEYAVYLDSIVPATAPNLRNLIAAALMEGSLKFSKVESERKQLLTDLVPRLSDAELKGLLEASVQFRAGQLTYSAYYDFIKALSAGHGLPLTRFPEMNIYIQYVLKSESIDHRKLFVEVSQLEAAVQKQLASTEAQRALLSLIGDYHLLGKLVNRGLIESEWHAYEGRRADVARLLERLSALGGGRPATLVDMAPRWTTFDAFYVAALKRNRAMTDNLAAAIEKSGARHAVMVAGGFHAEGLAALFEEKNFNVLVLSPKITKQNDGPSSLDFLAAGRLPLDEIFSGEKLFIPTEAATMHPGDMVPTVQGSVTAVAHPGVPQPVDAERGAAEVTLLPEAPANDPDVTVVASLGGDDEQVLVFRKREKKTSGLASLVGWALSLVGGARRPGAEPTRGTLRNRVMTLSLVVAGVSVAAGIVALAATGSANAVILFVVGMVALIVYLGARFARGGGGGRGPPPNGGSVAVSVSVVRGDSLR